MSAENKRFIDRMQYNTLFSGEIRLETERMVSEAFEAGKKYHASVCYGIWAQEKPTEQNCGEHIAKLWED